MAQTNKKPRLNSRSNALEVSGETEASMFGYRRKRTASSNTVLLYTDSLRVIQQICS
jgi:hypothetical protein